MPSICIVDGCSSEVRSLEMCSKHYFRVRRHGHPTEIPTIRGASEQERFLHNLMKLKTPCWIWRKHIRPDGYGVFSVEGGGTEPAHRASWRLANGHISAGLQVNHKCHNRACVNPDHLYLGTQLENMADMKGAGRSRINRRRGEEHAAAKLTSEKVVAILASTETTAALARQYGVSESLVRAVRQRAIWKHINV